MPSRSAGSWTAGCDVLLVETIFDTLMAKACLAAILDAFEQRGERLPTHDFGHRDRSEWAHANWPNARGVLDFNRARTRLSVWRQLRVGSARDAAATCRSWRC